MIWGFLNVEEIFLNFFLFNHIVPHWVIYDHAKFQQEISVGKKDIDTNAKKMYKVTPFYGTSIKASL
jgi:hypothetical protein